MKKIITAIGNQNLNQQLKTEEEIKIETEDISYQEGIIEILEKNNKLDFLILSELLPGNYEIKELIEKIKTINEQLKIIIILEQKNQELENYLYAKGIYSIFYHNQIEIKEIINLIKNNSKEKDENIKKELEELKKILLEKENKKLFFNKLYPLKNKNKSNSIYLNLDSNNQDNLFLKLEKKEKLKREDNKKDIICVSGTSRSRKKYF